MTHFVAAEDRAESTRPRYAVVGNPVAHSLSPQIHAEFARSTGLTVDYRRLLAPLDGFAQTVERFFAGGGRGLNVTLPFKLEARAACEVYCGRVSARARQAGAVNCIARDEQGLFGDNTDGVGLVNDLVRLTGASGQRLSGSRVLLLGAGGAARGVLGPLLGAGPRRLVVVNRDRAKAAALVAAHSGAAATLDARSFDALGDEPFDLIVNATSASLAGHALPLPPAIVAGARLVYDMMYGATPTAFLAAARQAGAEEVVDGLGMLVEQAAESFLLWHGVRPATAPVREQLRAMLQAARGR